jgi:ferritin-like metal-binding protein YciE
MNEDLKSLLEESLRDLYSAESMIVTQGLPEMLKLSTNEELKSAFESHLEESKTHLSRLEELAEKMNISLEGKKCVGMEGIIAEGHEIKGMGLSDESTDVALASAAQKVEHYEISGYTFAIMLAESLGNESVAEILEETLDEELNASDSLGEFLEEILSDNSMDEEELLEDEDFDE